MTNEILHLRRDVRELSGIIETMNSTTEHLIKVASSQQGRIDFLENLLHSIRAHESTCASLKPNFANRYTPYPCDCWVALPRPF